MSPWYTSHVRQVLYIVLRSTSLHCDHSVKKIRMIVDAIYNKCPLPLTDPRNTVHRAHRSVHKMSTVSVINCVHPDRPPKQQRQLRRSAVPEIWLVTTKFLTVCLKIEIHKIYEIHMPKYRNPPTMYEIHCLKIKIHKVHEIHSKSTLTKYRNPRNPQTVRNPHGQGSQQTNRQLL